MLIPTGRDLAVVRCDGDPRVAVQTGVDRALGSIGVGGGLMIELMLVLCCAASICSFPQLRLRSQIQECRSSIRRPFQITEHPAASSDQPTDSHRNSAWRLGRHAILPRPGSDGSLG